MLRSRDTRTTFTSACVIWLASLTLAPASDVPVVSTLVAAPTDAAPGLAESLTVVDGVNPAPRPIASEAKAFALRFQVKGSEPANDLVRLLYRVLYQREAGIDLRAVEPGIFAGEIPAHAMASLGSGHLLRWRVEVERDGRVVAQEPPAFRPGIPAYHGTVAQDPHLQSALPVLYVFSDEESVQNQQGLHDFAQVAADRKGKPVSLYFVEPGQPTGVYYDSVTARLRGQTTATFDKKPQKFSFPESQRFAWDRTSPPLPAINLLSNTADKSKIRNALAWQFWNTTDHPAHRCRPVRVQQMIPSTWNTDANTQFLGIFDLLDADGPEFLVRNGLDGRGALYKCYNALESAQPSKDNSRGVEKKTREEESHADLEELVAALDPKRPAGERDAWLFQRVDVAALIHFLAVQTLLHNPDFGSKNYYLYCDTEGTRQWSPLPWDIDLSFGKTWTPELGHFDDHLTSAGGLVMGETRQNRLFRPVMVEAKAFPVLARMALRRLRTLMDIYLGPPENPSHYFPTKAAEWLDRLYPHDDDPQLGTDDADLDLRRWGFWVHGSGKTVPASDPRARLHTARAQAARILDSNPVPPYPGSPAYELLGDNPVLHNTLPAFLPGRRAYLYSTRSGRPALTGGFFIPEAQEGSDQLSFTCKTHTSPGSWLLHNRSQQDVDLSRWRLAGQVNHEFKPGTVLLGQGQPYTSAATRAPAAELVLVPDVAAFRRLIASPDSKPGLHVQLLKPAAVTGQENGLQLLRPIYSRQGEIEGYESVPLELGEEK